MCALYDLAPVRSRAQSGQGNDEQQRVQHDEERGQPVGRECDSEGRTPTAEGMDDQGATLRNVDESQPLEQHHEGNDQRDHPRGTRRWSKEPEQESRHARQC